MAVQATAVFHQGPLPPARELAAYEQAHPGAAAWILKEAERNAEHVRQMETIGARLQIRDALLFRVLPFSVVTVYILSTMAIAIFANAWVGGTLLATGLAGVATAYVKCMLPGANNETREPARKP
jgi:uncharacterized membrane protein